MDVDSTLVEAEAQHKRGQLDSASEIYQSILNSDPNNADACYGLGTILAQRQDFQASYDYLKQAISLQPDTPEFLVNLAMTLEKLARPNEAAEFYRSAINLAEGDTEVFTRAGTRLVALGFGHNVLEYLQHVDTSIPEIALLKSRSESAIGNWAGATLSLQAIVKLNPENRALWKELATAAARLRDYQLAISAFQHYLFLGEENAEDLLAFADLLFMAREIEKARQLISRLQNMIPDNAQLQLLQAKCLRLQGDYESARQHVLAAVELSPDSGVAWQLRLESEPDNLRNSLADQCLEIANRPSTSVRNQTLLQLTAGKALEMSGKYQQAFSCYYNGNEVHKLQLASEHKSYKANDTEQFSEKMVELFSEYKACNEDLDSQPIFIVGMPRSGTTLIERILAEHDGVTAGGENEAMEFIAARYYWNLEQGNQSPPQQLNAENLQQLQEQYWIRTNLSPRIVTDKMPHNFRHVGLIKLVFPAAPIIYIRRDPRDICLSIYSRMFPDGHGYACDLEALAHFSHHCTKLMNYWQKLLADQLLVIDFEELIANPEAVSQRLAEHCNLTWNPNCLDFHLNLAPSYTFSEIQVRRPINNEGLGRWKNYEKELSPLIIALRKYGEID